MASARLSLRLVGSPGLKCNANGRCRSLSLHGCFHRQASLFALLQMRELAWRRVCAGLPPSESRSPSYHSAWGLQPLRPASRARRRQAKPSSRSPSTTACADQYQGLAALNAHGMHATYYLNSPKIGGDSRLHDLAARSPTSLQPATRSPATPPTTPTCRSSTRPRRSARSATTATTCSTHGYSPTNFAYPYGDYSPAVKTMVQNCGYNSARTTDVFPQANPSGPIPPPDPYQIDVGTDDTTVDVDGERGQRGSHRTAAAGCRSPSTTSATPATSNYITLADFNTFLDWLQGQSGNGVVVRDDAAGARRQRCSLPFRDPAFRRRRTERTPCGTPRWSRTRTATRMPDCWSNDDFGNNNFTWTRTQRCPLRLLGGEASTSPTTRTATTSCSSQQDLGYCTPSVNSGAPLPDHGVVQVERARLLHALQPRQPVAGPLHGEQPELPGVLDLDAGELRHRRDPDRYQRDSVRPDARIERLTDRRRRLFRRRGRLRRRRHHSADGDR